MKITFKLYAGLQEFLPKGSKDNAIELEITETTSIDMIASNHRLPPELLQLVLVNGVFIPPSKRPDHLLVEGDVLAIWPPVAGG